MTGQVPQVSGQQSSLVVQDSKNGTGGHTPSDTLSQSTLNPPRESLSSSSTTTNKEPGVNSENLSSSAISSISVTTSNTIIPTSTSVIGGSAPQLPHSSSLQQTISKPHSQRLRFVQSVELRHSSGERSTTPLSPESPTEDSSGETQKPHRLQRSKAQSRKTFRLKRAQNSSRDLLGGGTGQKEGFLPSSSPPSLSQASSTATLTAIVTTSSLTSTPPTSSNFSTALIKPITDFSWDSVSQTSSTSGYRDNYSFQTGFLSPDDKTSSQQSLLMLFEAQDEDTLI